MPKPPRKLPAPPPVDLDWQAGQSGAVAFGPVRLDIPARAFGERVSLRVSVPDTPPPVPGHLTMPFVFRVEAAAKATGAIVSQLGATIRFTIDFAELSHYDWGQTFVHLYYFDEESQRWTKVAGRTDMAAKRIVAAVGHFTDFGFGGDDGTMPSAPANLEGYSVDLCTGYASASLSLKVPPGINGMTPALELRYSSGKIDQVNQNLIVAGSFGYENTRALVQASPVGLGWSLDLGAVFRSSETDPAGNPKYYLLLNGRTIELQWLDGTVFRTIPEEFLRVSRLTGSPNNQCPSHEYWLIEAKDGKRYRYGYNADSEQRAGRWHYGSDGVQKAWQWSLDKITDTHGNEITITYVEDSAQPPLINGEDVYDDRLFYDQAAYPSVISYGGNTGQGFTANREIRFYYSARTDCVPIPEYTQFYWQKKLDRVEMHVGGSLGKAYDLGHAYTDGTTNQHPQWFTETQPGYPTSQQSGIAKLLLTTLTEKDAGGNALPATSFGYWWNDPIQYDRYSARLKTVANGYGGTTTFDYEAHWMDGWWKLAKRFRVKTHSVDPGTGARDGQTCVISHAYTYGTSRNVGSSYDYRGHDWVEVADAAGHKERTYFYTRDAANGKGLSEVEALQTRPYRKLRWASGGSEASFATKEETDWGLGLPGGLAPAFVHVDEVRSYIRTAAGGLHSRKTCYGYDGYGNTVSAKEYASADADPLFWSRVRVLEFYPSTAPTRYIADRLARERVFQPNGDCLRETRYCYDNSTRHDNPIGSGQYGDDASLRGRLTAVRRVLDIGRCVDLTYGYDGYGHQTSMTEYGGYGTPGGGIATADPRTTTVSFETTHRTYPHQVTNPLSQVATRLYDARWGRPTQHTDANGAVSNWDYDSYGRLTKVEGPAIAGPGGSYRRTTEHTYALPAQMNNRWTTMVKTKRRVDTGGETPAWLSSWQHYDGIGRVVQAYADAAGGVNVSNSYYNARGLSWKASVPHFLSGSSWDAFQESDWANSTAPTTLPLYDELGRVTQTTLPDSQITKTEYDGWHRNAIDQNNHKKRFENDWAGRTIAVNEYTGTNPWTLYATTAYQYDLADLLVKVTDALGNQTLITYDNLGRKLSMVDPDMGTWRYEYDPLSNLSAQTDAKEQRVEFAYDALRRLVRTWFRPTWTQDVLTGGASKPSVYDLMELRAAIRTAGKAAGLSTGAWANDEIWTDPEIVAGTGVAIRAVHWTELRDRMQDLWTAASLGTVPQFTAGSIVSGTRKIDSGDPIDLRNWLNSYEASAWAQTRRARVFAEYDGYDGTTQFGKGRRTAMWDGACRCRYYYDKAGRTWKQTCAIDGAVYTTQWSYDALDRLYQMTYPDNEVLTYGYAANGLLGQITSGLGNTLASAALYNALNLPAQYTVGNGTTAQARHTYYGPDASGYPYGAMKTIQLQKGSDPMLVNREMTYDPVGNVSGINDLANSENIAYSYDDLDRMLSVGSPVSETFAYNEIGNITSKNSVSYNYDASHKHAVASHNGVSYAYDANGSMITRGAQLIRYDKQCRPVRVDAGGSAICRFAYDGDGVRRKRLDASGTIHYLGAYERNVGNGQATTPVVTKYYAAAFGGLSRLIAFRKAGVLHFAGTDHLGSTIRVADSSFAALDQMRYRPYGAARDAGSNLNTDHKFTSQIEDASIGLYWYASRAYDPALARFVSPDTIVPSAGNPQSLNRYSYTLNNPLKYVDPSGHLVDDAGSGGWFDDSWQQDFREAHGGADPTEGDYQYRWETMAAASGFGEIAATSPLAGSTTVSSGWPVEGDANDANTIGFCILGEAGAGQGVSASLCPLLVTSGGDVAGSFSLGTVGYAGIGGSIGAGPLASNATKASDLQGWAATQGGSCGPPGASGGLDLSEARNADGDLIVSAVPSIQAGIPSPLPCQISGGANYTWIWHWGGLPSVYARAYESGVPPSFFYGGPALW